jgi:K(+)-stimulated pyrophosphate-energized sodium pump
LIKVMNLISLLILPAVINAQDSDGTRFTVAGIALVVLIAAIAYSKRKGETMDDPTSDPAVGELVA